jgi:hypothetical protein
MKFKYDNFVEVCAHRIGYWFEGESTLTDMELRNRLLEEEAESRSKECLNEGYVSGELNIETDSISARGWWNIEK